MSNARADKHLQVGKPEVYLHRARVAKALESGADIIDLGYADVRREPPRQVLESLREKLQNQPSLNHYGEVPGLMALRKAVAADLSLDDEHITAEQVIITAGANHGVVLALLATTDAKDLVALPIPFFFNHVTQIQYLGRSVHAMATSAADNYALAPTAWDRAFTIKNVRAVLLAQPRNPTSTQMPDADLEILANAASKRERPVIIDEFYREFGKTLGQYPRIPTGASIIRVGSLSKSFCLAGWRVGYLVAPLQFRERIITAQDALMIYPGIAAQHVALAALEMRGTTNFTGDLAAEIAGLRTKVREELEKCSWISEVFAEAGTFVWIRLHEGLDASEIASRLLTECGVALLSGDAFGVSAEPCMRMGIGCVSPLRLAEALERLVKWNAQ